MERFFRHAQRFPPLLSVRTPGRWGWSFVAEVSTARLVWSPGVKSQRVNVSGPWLRHNLEAFIHRKSTKIHLVDLLF